MIATRRRSHMRTTRSPEHIAAVGLLTVALALSAHLVAADDLAGSDRFLCAAVQAAVCSVEGDCATELPWNLNIPKFVEVDLDARRLSTTAASGENRTTPIDHLSRNDGTIVFHGFEMGRAFSWVITERTGNVTAAVSAEDIAVAVFGACTPIDSSREEMTP